MLIMLPVSLALSCKKDIKNENIPETTGGVSQRPFKSNDLKDSVNAVINKYISAGIPGIHVAVKTGRELIIADGGYASVENKVPIDPFETDWIFSITKTFTAALVMKEVEKGTLNLDKKINCYLHRKDADSITGSNIITLRMLLNHTSGLIDFTALPEFIEAQFEHPLQQPSVRQKMKLVYGRPLTFQPGTDFSYSNTNYLLLYTILENVTRKPYEFLLRNEIIRPLALTATWYDIGKVRLKQLNFPNYYFDPSATGTLVNATDWNTALANTSLGYGGIAAKATDVIKFYQALINGQVVTSRSFLEMTKWVQGKESYQPDYGLGIEYYQFAPGTTPQLGHEGDGVGCTTQVMYVPDTKTYLYINCTVGRKIPGPFLYKTTDFKNELCSLIARWR